MSNVIIESITDGLASEPDYTVSQWADNYRVLPQKASAEPGKYRTDRAPYLREIMDNLSIFSGVQETCVMKATQLGMTESGNNWLGYVVDASPGPMLMIFPTDTLARDHSRQKLQPTIDETPRLAGKIAEAKSRSGSNTMSCKEFPGGILFMSGSNSPANYRSKSVRYLFLDDLDGFPMSVGDEGDPADLARKRTDTFSYRKKIFEVSTPTVKGVSRIEASFNESDQRRYHVPCPFCGHMQVLTWGGKGTKKKKIRHGIKFKRDSAGEIIAVWYECESCHEGIDESHKTEMLAKGEWVPKYPERKKRGYHLNSLYSPIGWVSWYQVADEFLKAKDSPERLQVWTNTRLADVWDQEGSQPEWSLLKARARSYEAMTVPIDPALPCLLSAGVDVQENRLVVIVRAWGKDEENFLTYYTELYGDPNQAEVWNQLTHLANRPFIHETGAALHIVSMAIDTGYLTQTVYNFCRSNPRYMAIKGAKSPASPIISKPRKVDVTWSGQTIKGGVDLWSIGTDSAKVQIYSRLAMKKRGPGYYHFYAGLDDEYYLQLTAEKRLTQYRDGFPVLSWVKLRERNDVLDCEVYTYAAALRAGLVHLNFDEIYSNLLSGPGARGGPDRPKATKQKPKRKRW